MKAIADCLHSEFAKDKNWKKITEYRFLKELDKTSTWTFISDKIVVILAAKKELTGILKENEEIANYHKFIFDKLWKEAKEA